MLDFFMQKIPVTVVIPVRNEEKNLPKCLELLGEFSEVIVVDSNSTDRTPDIVKDYGYHLINFEWNGHFPKKRNWVLQNIPLKNEWVLFLDADEFITEAFKEELQEKIQSNEYNGFWVSYSNHFLGKNLKHGIKMKKLPVFRKGYGEYEFIDEDAWSHLDMEVHEHPIIQGKTGEIKSPVIHLDFKGLYHYIARHNEYSSWEANRYLKLLDTKDKKFTLKQKIKYRFINTWLFGFWYFLLNYVFFLGFLDGKAGYVFSVYKMHYFFSIKAKIVELKQVH
ncbi:glycosyl transferase [Bacteroidia bacterium]|nr:glycosyl transferase [Bacteroidia bacterium]